MHQAGKFHFYHSDREENLESSTKQEILSHKSLSLLSSIVANYGDHPVGFNFRIENLINGRSLSIGYYLEYYLPRDIASRSSSNFLAFFSSPIDVFFFL